MHRNFLMTAVLLGALSVLLGAFAAHQLKQVVSADVLQLFETGVRYQVYHLLALLATGIMYQSFPVKHLQWAGKLFISGIILFSGSLYLLCFVKHNNIQALWAGAITPFGGLCFIAGWIFLALGVAKKPNL